MKKMMISLKRFGLKLACGYSHTVYPSKFLQGRLPVTWMTIYPQFFILRYTSLLFLGVLPANSLIMLH